MQDDKISLFFSLISYYFLSMLLRGVGNKKRGSRIPFVQEREAYFESGVLAAEELLQQEKGSK